MHSGGNCANAVVWQWHWHCAHYSQLDKFLEQILAAAAAAESVEYGGGGEWQNGENVLSAESERKGERERERDCSGNLQQIDCCSTNNRGAGNDGRAAAEGGGY